MIVKKVRTKSPLRIGLAGGGTDISPYCDIHTGFILNTTIDKYVYCTLEINLSGNVEFTSGDLGESSRYCVQKNIPLDGKLDLFKAVYNRLSEEFDLEVKGLNIYTFSEAPRGSGLGGSSTLIVAIIKAFCECFNLALGVYEIARLAYSIEREDLAWSGGKQDQYAATFGGFNFMEFSANNHVVVNPLDLKNWIINELQSHSFLGFSGISREGSHVIDDQSKGVSLDKEDVVNSLHQIKKDANDMKLSLINGDFREMATILNRSWEAKKRTSNSVSNDRINHIIDVAKQNGALACKVSGAGGGGFVYFMAEPTSKFHIMRKLLDIDVTTYNIHFSPRGTQAWTLKT